MSWRSVAVIGGGEGSCTLEMAGQAQAVGRLLAQAGASVICGGLGGVMESVCLGAKEAGGQTIGILPGRDPAAANPFVDIPVATGLGEFRNFIIASAADAAIAVGGEFGTLSEIAMALKLGKKVVGLGTWDVSKDGIPSDAILKAESPEEAVRLALE